VLATWPLLSIVQKRLWNKRALAVTVMTVALVMILVIPLSYAIATIVDQADTIIAWFESLSSSTIPPPPDWLGKIPLLGPKLTAYWSQAAAFTADEIAARLTPYAGKVVGWFVAQAGNMGMMILQFLLTVIISAILYAHGEMVAAGVLHFARRLAGEKGEEVAVLAGKAVRGVALGIVLSALIQSGLGGLGLAVSGLPASALLTAVMFILCIAQLGPGLVLIPAVVWVYWQAGTLWGTLLLIWTVPVLVLDNFLRPVLIKKGADLPLLLIFTGVIGGLVAMGIIGLFIGPVTLAVTFTLLKAWVSYGQTPPEESAA
jgi:predicted PurR-regulated permease PerM